MKAPAGKPVVLQSYQADRDYGVKVVANLTTKTADVYVDGARRAKAAPFCRPIASIDYVLVKTGDAAVGEMFLGPVNVYKGYTVNETFVTAGVGRIPDDWMVFPDGGVATVEKYECSTKPDIFSLKLCGGNREGAATPFAAVVKGFPPLRGKTVFQCRFLLPEKATGFRASLDCRGAQAVRIMTVKKDLCVDKVPLVHDYRSNLWYMLKVIADPVAKTADIYINGKLAAEHVAISPDVDNFDAVSFATQFRSVAWIDDVQVYPWEDYPADYVPQPKPCPAGPYLLGAQSCNLWREGNSYAGWEYVYPYRDKRKPYLGWYDEGHPEEVDWEIKWQVEHGITFEQHCWYRPNNAINHPIKDGVLDQGIIKGLFNARYSHLKKFTIMCTNEGACETNADDFRNNIIPYWIEYFFKDPRYLTVDGKPVLSIYHYGNWLRMFGGQEGGRAAIQMLRDEVAKAGLPGIIVLMEERSGDEKTLRIMKSLGVDYCYSYTWFTPSADVERARMLNSRDHCAAVGLKVLPSISMGWDREAWGVHDGGWLSFADYKKLAGWTRDVYMPSLPAGSLGRRMVLLANWNEFGEGHFMLPNASGRFGYLDALRDVFTVRGAPSGYKTDRSTNTTVQRVVSQRLRFNTVSWDRKIPIPGGPNKIIRMPAAHENAGKFLGDLTWPPPATKLSIVRLPLLGSWWL